MNTPQRILVVDDEQEILDVYATKLTMVGYEVSTALNGEEAIKMAKEKKPALILLDLKMPVMDGMTALSKLKEDPETSAIKVVFLTAFSDPNVVDEDVAVAKEVGALDFLKKGIKLEELVSKVRSYIGE